jgi:hypothetical protein
MVEEALIQVTCRLSLVRDTFESLSKLSPLIILNQISRPMFSKLPFIHHAGNNVSNIEEQYRQMSFVDWKEEAPFKKDGLPADTEQFWIGVLQNNTFKELATFAPTCLITPCQQCCTCEDILPLYLNLLDATVRAREELMLSSKCCKDFTASPEMLKKT